MQVEMDTGRVGVAAKAFPRGIARCPYGPVCRIFLVLAVFCGSVVSESNFSRCTAISDLFAATVLLAGVCRVVTSHFPTHPQRESRPVTATMGIRN